MSNVTTKSTKEYAAWEEEFSKWKKHQISSKNRYCVISYYNNVDGKSIIAF